MKWKIRSIWEKVCRLYRKRRLGEGKIVSGKGVSGKTECVCVGICRDRTMQLIEGTHQTQIDSFYFCQYSFVHWGVISRFHISIRGQEHWCTQSHCWRNIWSTGTTEQTVTCIYQLIIIRTLKALQVDLFRLECLVLQQLRQIFNLL